MKKTTKKVVTAFMAMIVVAVLVLSGYYFLIVRGDANRGERLPETEVGKLLAKDIELKYPGTPSEVIKLYWRMNKCLYNESMKDEDFNSLIKQLRLLYDEELLAEEGNSYEKMCDNFRKEKEAFRKEKRLIASYMVDSETDVEYAELDDRECATLKTMTLEKIEKKTKKTKTAEQFICRKDDSGKWKILGWKQIDSEGT